MGLVGERKALAAAILALYTLIYLVNALMPPDPALGPLFTGMAGLYGLAFFALVAGYFWARWFAIGLGIYGLIGGVMMIWQMGLEYVFLFYGGTHGLVSLILWGDRVAGDFDGRTEWRERFHMDESATRRLGNAVIRVGVSLPILLAYGLAPRAATGDSAVVLLVLALAGVGVMGLLRLRTWGVFAMAGAALAILGTLLVTSSIVPLHDQGLVMDVGLAGLGGGILLLTAAAPFAGPIIGFLRR